jgi:hypothetical protein
VIAVRGDVLLARVAEPVGRGPPGAAPHDRRIRDGEVVGQAVPVERGHPRRP